jgi:hypothetical protein
MRLVSILTTSLGTAKMPRQRKLDHRFIARQLTPFRQALQGGIGKVLTYSGGRFNAKAYSRCSSVGIFDRKNTSEKGKPKIALIVDCSGSMGGDPIKGAAHMCAILSKLDQADAIDARIFCTGASKGKGGGFRVPLPQPDFVWEYLAAYHGHEFLSQTFTKFRQEIVDCDLVACYTDADICDKRLNPSLWRSRGTSCVGLYCGDVGQVDVMNRYFDFSIARETPSALFHEYLRLVRRLLDK